MPKSYRNNIQDERITSLEVQIIKMSDYFNHQITQVRKDISDINVSLASIKSNQKILLGFMMAIIVALISLFFK